MKNILTILLVAFSTSGIAQITFQKTFSRILGDYDIGYSVQQTTDGGFIVAGLTRNWDVGHNYDKVYLIKTNNSGDTFWTRTFGGGYTGIANSVQQTTDGGYIIAGIYYNDVYLIKTDSNGDTLWTRTFNISTLEYPSVLQTMDGGYIIAGNGLGTGGPRDVYLIKTDGSGDTLWTKTFGGLDFDIAYSIQLTSDSGFIIAGCTTSFGAGSYDVYLIKTDGNGNLVWTKAFGGSLWESAYSVKQTKDSGYIVVGTTSSFGAGGGDIYIIKTDSNGDTLWTRTIGGTYGDVANSVSQTADGGYIIAGLTNYDAFVIKTDNSGDTLWTKTFGGITFDEANSIQQTSDGGYIIAGYTYVSLGDSADVYLIKTDSFGNSGCNERNPQFVISIPATQVTSPATIVTTTPLLLTTRTTIMGSGGIITTLCTNAGIGDISFEEHSFSIYPNPTTNSFTINNISFKGKTVVEVINPIGEIVYSKKLFGKDEYLIDANFEKGIYFVRVNDVVRKLIIE